MAASQSPPDPVTISWSGLKRWENCPQHQLRVIKHEVEKQEKGRIFLPGTVCDLVQRRWLDSPDPRPGEMVDLVEVVFEDVLAEGESRIKWFGNPNEDRAKVKNFCRTTVQTLEPWLLENVLPFDYQPEVKFQAFQEIPYLREGVRAPLKMIGGIDLVVRRDDGKFRLYDLKITQNAGYIRSTLAQLTFYDIAWSIIQGSFESVVEWGFVTPALTEQYIPVQVGQEDRRMMMSRIMKYAHGVWRDQWDPKPDDEGCQWCEAKNWCEKFKVVPIVEANGKQKVSFTETAAHRRKFRADTEGD